GIDSDRLEYGTLALVTDHAKTTYKRAWVRGFWWDYLREFWDDLESDGLLTDLNYTEPGEKADTASLGLVDTLQPGESRSFRFILTWYFPNRVNSWDIQSSRVIRNHYATRFDDAWKVAGYVLKDYERLESNTKAFHDALFASTFPAPVLDAVSA